MSLASGEIFEQRYEIRSELSVTESSALYRATSLDSGRDVAVRLLLAPKNGYPAGFENKFVAESKRVSKLRHASTVHLESFGVSDGVLFMITEFIPGTMLDAALEEEEVPVRDALGLVRRLAEGLGEAHERGIVHRELSPKNVAVPLRRGVLGAKLRDYGITKCVDNDSGLASAATLGGPRYLSPEQLLGEELTPASNIYSLGLIAYELLAHEPCVTAKSYREILATHLSTAPYEIPITVPPSVRAVVQKMIAKSQADRYQSTEELLDALLDVDRANLGLTAQLKVARMVAALEASDDDGGNAADTIVDPNFLEPDTGEATKERFQEDVSADPTEQPDELTPTSVVVSDGDITQLAEESSAPTSVGHASQEEPTDEVEDKTKPTARPAEARERTVRERKPTERNEREGREGRERGSEDRERRERGSERGSEERERRRSSRPPGAKGSSSRRKKKKKSSSSRRSGRSKGRGVEDDRVPLKVAVLILLGVAVAAGLLFWAILKWSKSAGRANHEAVTRVVTASTATPATDPADPLTNTGAPIPSISKDLGLAESFDPSEIRTGCGIERDPGWTVEKAMAGLTEHTFDVYIPTSYTGTPIPVILAVHPATPVRGLIGREWANHVGLVGLAEELPAILLTPVDKKPMRPWLTDLKDTENTFGRVLDHAAETFCVDLTRVFGVGMSAGAQALDRYACQHPDRFRALGLVAHWKTHTSDCSNERRPPMMVVNGLADPIAPVEGGPGCYGFEVKLSLDDATAAWRKQGKCSETASTWAEHDAGSCKAYDDCEQDLVMCLLPKGGHGWSGSKASQVRCLGDFGTEGTLTSFPTSQMLLKFLKEQVN